ncbi:unnamed protein product [Linum trigynum]|uniref:Uncharacterized protein n=1 Tax=Linum trigynum TaxID=586398 RepID=A0AAV2D892_9ROSI
MRNKRIKVILGLGDFGGDFFGTVEMVPAGREKRSDFGVWGAEVKGDKKRRVSRAEEDDEESSVIEQRKTKNLVEFPTHVWRSHPSRVDGLADSPRLVTATPTPAATASFN